MYSSITAACWKRIIWQNLITCICLRRVMIDHKHGFAFLSHFTHKCKQSNASLSISALLPSVMPVWNKIVDIFVDMLWKLTSTNDLYVQMTNTLQHLKCSITEYIQFYKRYRSMWIRFWNTHESCWWKLNLVHAKYNDGIFCITSRWSRFRCISLL